MTFVPPEIGSRSSDITFGLSVLAFILVATFVFAGSFRAPKESDRDDTDNRTPEQRAREAFDDLREW